MLNDKAPAMRQQIDVWRLIVFHGEDRLRIDEHKQLKGAERVMHREVAICHVIARIDHAAY
jgi:hypothetical protein